MALLLKCVDSSKYFHLLYKNPDHEPLLDLALCLDVLLGIHAVINSFCSFNRICPSFHFALSLTEKQYKGHRIKCGFG